ncbi:MAG: glycosyltransferase family 4 protein, partial [Acidimicrobiales bacterium]
EQVWPYIHRQCPDARLVLAGGRPAPDLLAHRGEDVGVTGYLPSLAPCYAEADVFVAPVPAGGGLKFKVAQAMLCGLPVVATPIAAEGILDRAGPEIFGAVTDNPKTMAASVASLLKDPERAAALGEAARQWATQAWDFPASEERIAALYSALARGTSVPQS